MPPLPITSLTAALLALIFVALTIRTAMARGKAGASLGDGGGGVIRAGEEHTVPLLVATRSHANFCEWVPLSVILLALSERAAAPHWLALSMAALLVVGRLLHPIGMGRKIPNPFRGGGIMLNLVMILAATVFLLLRAATARG